MNTISPKQKFLERKTKEPVDWLQVNYIIKEVSNDFGVESKMLLSASRKQKFVLHLIDLEILHLDLHPSNLSLHGIQG